MKKWRSQQERAARFLKKKLRKGHKGWTHRDAPDVRQAGKVTIPMSHILWSLELGLLSNQPTLRDVEELTQGAAGWIRSLVPAAISDTTLDTEVRRLDVKSLRHRLHERVRDFYRSKMLQPVGLPCGIATLDGKNLATLNHDAGGTGHARSTKNEKWHRKPAEEAKRGKNYYLMPALRAVLTSSEAKVCIDQLALPPGTGESTSFGQMVEDLHRAYGRSGMFEVIDGDAGLTSLANANAINRLGYAYILGLKGNQPDLFAEAQFVLETQAKREAPEAETPWELRNGIRIRRRLWRTKEMAGFETSAGRWGHLRQVLLVRQETKHRDGHIAIEDRYFVTSLLWNYFSPSQILIAVRNHWGIENDANNTMDLQWHEDSGPWCTKGTAIWALGVLRQLAYNTVQILRRRRLRKKRPDGSRAAPMSWRSLFKLIEDVLRHDLDVLVPAG
ncbi:MAG: ISAs1 family transposase [Lentisphaeria bacterium]|nr:ISAs1 family transposase [Lentisphaeria bacterium]